MKSTLQILLSPLIILTFVSCGDSGASGPNLVKRELSEAENQFKLVDSSAERFRYQSRPTNNMPSGAVSEPTGRSSAAPSLVYVLPEGWSEQAGSAMRDVNLSFGPNGKGECYVARLPGMGGGLLPNVNRWRQQMGAEPLTQEQVEALPVKPLFGQPATFVELDGTFTGMGATPQENYRMLGLILASNAGAVFVKMTGPRALVKENEAGFDTFTGSLDISQ
ncbi:MAG: hypothetical protein AAGA96_02800 [Verrucomicrobiota bacterium]